MCAHLVHAWWVELCIVSDLWEDIYIYNRHTYIHTYICIKIVHLGELSWMFGKIVEFFWYLNQCSLSPSKARKDTHFMWVLFFLWSLIYAVWSFKMCQTRVFWVFFEANWVTLMERIVVGEICETFVSTYLYPSHLSALWKFLCIDSLGGFITLVIVKD
jgi:hypothetical protein